MSDPIAEQASYWDAWNAENREHAQSDISHDQKEAALGWLSATGRFDLDILEVGCGAGWLCPWLKPYGRVTATDLSPDVLRRAAERIAGVEFINGDFMTLDFPEHGFDVVATLEVLSHVGDQPAFIAKIARLLRRGGVLILATQNRPVLERHNKVAPTQAGHLRRWFDRNELSELLAPHFTVEAMRTMTPIANKGPMRLIAGRWGRRVMRALYGRRLETTLGSAGFGWTLMTLARKA